MNVFYEEQGVFKVAAVLSESSAALQVEASFGKRSKIKNSSVLLRFESALSEFIDQAQAIADQLDIDFLWHCSSKEEFDFCDLAHEYFGQHALPIEKAAIAMVMHQAPMYFYRKGKGCYKAAPESNLKAALQAQQRKQLEAEQLNQFVEQLTAGILPTEFAGQCEALCYAPDKNSLSWKAVQQVALNQNTHPLQVLADVGAIASPHDFHFGAFVREYFPQGTDFPAYQPLAELPGLPESQVLAFSIDDESTTEIDDAFSVTPLDNGNTLIGIHIAVPALGIAPGTDLDGIVQERLSTAYLPGYKVTMLPDDVVSAFSLVAGGSRPTLSLYLEVTPDYEVVQHRSCSERVQIIENLRHETLEPYFNEHNWQTDSGHPFWSSLHQLRQLALHLEHRRKPPAANAPVQVDYSFYVEAGVVRIVERQRASPLNKLVTELMIYANTHWGDLLARHQLPGIYRAQRGGKVYMTCKAEPHDGLGVDQYAWCSSPLRRAVDLLNQRQLLVALESLDADSVGDVEYMTSLMSRFEKVYAAYKQFQIQMEHYWCLQYLVQQQWQEVQAVVLRDYWVRLQGMPYTCKVNSLPSHMVQGVRVCLVIRRIDLLLVELDVQFKGVVSDDVS